MSQVLQEGALPWCPFCGGRLKPSAKTKEIRFEGRLLRIHANEYREFSETGLLRYVDSPRSGTFSQDAVDLTFLLLVFSTTLILILWVLLI